MIVGNGKPVLIGKDMGTLDLGVGMGYLCPPIGRHGCLLMATLESSTYSIPVITANAAIPTTCSSGLPKTMLMIKFGRAVTEMGVTN